MVVFTILALLLGVTCGLLGGENRLLAVFTEHTDLILYCLLYTSFPALYATEQSHPVQLRLPAQWTQDFWDGICTGTAGSFMRETEL